MVKAQPMDIRAEFNAELRSARRWLLVVGLLMFAMDLLYIYVLNNDLTQEGKNIITAISAGILGIFVALWWFAQKKPRLCLGLGLVVFWGLQIFNAIDDPSMIFKGLIVKILFTVALVKGLQSAGRAELLRAQLVQVFE